MICEISSHYILQGYTCCGFSGNTILWDKMSSSSHEKTVVLTLIVQFSEVALWGDTKLLCTFLNANPKLGEIGKVVSAMASSV